jgi:hypothetical protein
MRKILLIAGTVALIVVPAAAAKTWFRSVGGKTFTPGQVVATEVIGCPLPCPVRGTIVFLSHAEKREARLRLGVVDRAGGLRFRIPEVAAGSYRLVGRLPNRPVYPVSAPFGIK